MLILIFVSFFVASLIIIPYVIVVRAANLVDSSSSNFHGGDDTSGNHDITILVLENKQEINTVYRHQGKSYQRVFITRINGNYCLNIIYFSNTSTSST